MCWCVESDEVDVAESDGSTRATLDFDDGVATTHGRGSSWVGVDSGELTSLVVSETRDDIETVVRGVAVKEENTEGNRSSGDLFG